MIFSENRYPLFRIMLWRHPCCNSLGAWLNVPAITGRNAMANAKITWDHIHLRTPNPDGMAQWFEKMLGAEVKRSMQQGKERIDLKLGGANIFIAPIGDGENVNAAPK